MRQNPIEAAVAPVKADAIVRAGMEAEKIVQYVRDELTKVGFDINKACPRADSFRMNKRQYALARAKRNLFTQVTKWTKPTFSMGEPVIVMMDDTRIARFVEMSQKEAAEQYDLFVMKLVGKVGECESAKLDGNHVWGSSVLRVQKGDIFEKWKTKQIVNTSKLGKLFNQWPTRKVK